LPSGKGFKRGEIEEKKSSDSPERHKCAVKRRTEVPTHKKKELWGGKLERLSLNFRRHRCSEGSKRQEWIRGEGVVENR